MIDQKGKNFKVIVIELANRIRRKMGLELYDDRPREVDSQAVEDAEKLIEKLCAESHSSIGGFLEQLSEKWHAVRDITVDTEERQALCREIFTISHEIKDIGAMCGYELIAYFAESLRDYIAETEINMEAQRVIIQAHFDAMQLAHKQNIKKDEGEKATELKQLVKIAIQKYK